MFIPPANLVMERRDDNKEFIWLDRSKLGSIISRYPELRGPPGATGKLELVLISSFFSNFIRSLNFFQFWKFLILHQFDKHIGRNSVIVEFLEIVRMYKPCAVSFFALKF